MQVSSEEGAVISRVDLTNLLIKPEMKNRFNIREVMPASTPSSFKTKARAVKLFKLGTDKCQIARAIYKECAGKDALVTYKFQKATRVFEKYDLGEELAPYQHLVIRAILKHKFINPNMTGEVLLQLDTGLGKTRIGIGLIGKVGAKTLVACPTKHIASQWVDELEELSPDLNVIMYDNKKTKQDNFDTADVVICVFNTLREKGHDFFGRFSLLLIDEVHELTSNCNKEILWGAMSVRFICGLTATPEYSGNGLLPFVEGFLGKVFKASKIEGFKVENKNFNVTVNVVRHIPTDGQYLVPILNENGGNICTSLSISRIISDPERHQKIMDNILRLYNNGANVLVFCEHRDYCDQLYNTLVERFGEEEVKADVLKGGAKKEVIEGAGKCRIILTTYCYSRRGISYGHLNALVLATSRRSGIKQILGRILRYNSDEKIPRYVVDVWDAASVVKSQFYDRRKVYIERGYLIK